MITSDLRCRLWSIDGIKNSYIIIHPGAVEIKLKKRKKIICILSFIVNTKITYRFHYSSDQSFNFFFCMYGIKDYKGGSVYIPKNSFFILYYLPKKKSGPF